MGKDILNKLRSSEVINTFPQHNSDDKISFGDESLLQVITCKIIFKRARCTSCNNIKKVNRVSALKHRLALLIWLSMSYFRKWKKNYSYSSHYLMTKAKVRSKAIASKNSNLIWICTIRALIQRNSYFCQKKTVVGVVAYGVNNDDRNCPRLVENIIINHNQVDHCTFAKS